MNKKIAIIGTGNMGQAIAQSLIDKKVVNSRDLMLTNIVFNGLETFSKTDIIVTGNNKKAVNFADVIILAIKPQNMQEVLEEIKEDLREDKLIISIAAGISISAIERDFNLKIVRVMPNLAAKFGQSLSAWVKNKNVSTDDVKIVKKILGAIGIEVEVLSEDMIDRITPISGSGPAYIFLLAELLENAAKEFGFLEKTSEKIARQTIIGAAELLKNSSLSARELRANVTSKGGVTEKAIEVLEKGKLREIFMQAIIEGYNKTLELQKI